MSLKKFDIFPKVLDGVNQSQNLIGSIVSIITCIFILIVVHHETSSFLKISYNSRMSVDHPNFHHHFKSGQGLFNTPHIPPISTSSVISKSGYEDDDATSSARFQHDHRVIVFLDVSLPYLPCSELVFAHEITKGKARLPPKLLNLHNPKNTDNLNKDQLEYINKLTKENLLDDDDSYYLEKEKLVSGDDGYINDQNGCKIKGLFITEKVGGHFRIGISTNDGYSMPREQTNVLKLGLQNQAKVHNVGSTNTQNNPPGPLNYQLTHYIKDISVVPLYPSNERYNSVDFENELRAKIRRANHYALLVNKESDVKPATSEDGKNKSFFSEDGKHQVEPSILLKRAKQDLTQLLYQTNKGINNPILKKLFKKEIKDSYDSLPFGPTPALTSNNSNIETPPGLLIGHYHIQLVPRILKDIRGRIIKDYVSSTESHLKVKLNEDKTVKQQPNFGKVASEFLGSLAINTDKFYGILFTYDFYPVSFFSFFFFFFFFIRIRSLYLCQ